MFVYVLYRFPYGFFDKKATVRKQSSKPLLLVIRILQENRMLIYLLAGRGCLVRSFLLLCHNRFLRLLYILFDVRRFYRTTIGCVTHCCHFIALCQSIRIMRLQKPKSIYCKLLHIQYGVFKLPLLELIYNLLVDLQISAKALLACPEVLILSRI